MASCYTCHVTCMQGVLWELDKLGILKGKVKMAGASAGSLAIATYNCGLDVDKATEALFSFAADCRAKGTRYRLGEPSSCMDAWCWIA